MSLLLLFRPRSSGVVGEPVLTFSAIEGIAPLAKDRGFVREAVSATGIDAKDRVFGLSTDSLLSPSAGARASRIEAPSGGSATSRTFSGVFIVRRNKSFLR